MTLDTDSTTLKQNATVTAQITEDSPGRSWLVSVFVARPSGQPPILAGDIDVLLLGERGPMPLISRPPGPWVEAGGAAGTTANATFYFEAAMGTPTLVRISWAGEAAELSVRPSP